jgi:hypothetical protein
MDDPGDGSSLHCVVESGFTEDDEKDLLNEIVRLCLVSEDPVSNVAHGTRMSAEENGESFFDPLANLLQQPFIRGFEILGRRLGWLLGCADWELKRDFRNAANCIRDFSGPSKCFRKIGGFGTHTLVSLWFAKYW